MADVTSLMARLVRELRMNDRWHKIGIAAHVVTLISIWLHIAITLGMR